MAEAREGDGEQKILSHRDAALNSLKTIAVADLMGNNPTQIRNLVFALTQDHYRNVGIELIDPISPFGRGAAEGKWRQAPSKAEIALRDRYTEIALKRRDAVDEAVLGIIDRKGFKGREAEMTKPDGVKTTRLIHLLYAPYMAAAFTLMDDPDFDKFLNLAKNGELPEAFFSDEEMERLKDGIDATSENIKVYLDLDKLSGISSREIPVPGKDAVLVDSPFTAAHVEHLPARAIFLLTYFGGQGLNESLTAARTQYPNETAPAKT